MRSLLKKLRLCLLGVMVSATALHAQRAAAPRPRLHHTAWTLRDGAPGDVFALAQTSDGYLWLGTSTGLVRFDGVEFERFEARRGEALRSSNILSLLALPDGSLCIGYTFGGVSVLSAAGHLRHYGESEGLPRKSIYQILRDSSATLWAATNVGLFRRVDDRWLRMGPQDGIPDGEVRYATTDGAGTVWIAVTDVGVFALSRGSSRFVVHSAPHRGAHTSWFVSTTESGDALTGYADGPALHLQSLQGNERGTVARTLADADGTVLVGRDSSVWISTSNGVERNVIQTDSHGRVSLRSSDRFTNSGGLSGSLATSMLTDREGNVWLGTEGGLDRFRRPKLSSVELPLKFASPALVPGDSGDLWIGNTIGETRHFFGSPREGIQTTRNVQATFREPSGVIWFGSEDGKIWHLSPQGIGEDTGPPETAGAPIQALAIDNGGDLWISVPRRSKLFRRRGGTWRAFGDLVDLPRSAVIRMARDSIGALWFGYPDNRIARLSHDSVQVFDARDGIAIGNVTAVEVTRGHVWLGGDGGVMRKDGARFVAVNGESGSPFRGVTGIVERSNGELWLNGSDGVTRIAATDLEADRQQVSTGVHFERFDTRDGLDGVAAQLRPLPTALTTPDGSIWFTTSRSVERIDPLHIRRNLLPPPVHIRGVLAAGVNYEAADSVRLPASISSVQIRYTATSLSVPDRVSFRYRLTGSDVEWQDVGARREAFYTNLRPGTYTFRVIAANDDGVWNELGAATTITIPPTFLQTPAFLVLCCVAVGLLGVAGYRARVRAVAGALQQQYEVRLAERTRIAQDLHDTILQGFTGITLQLQGMKRSISSSQANASATLERILTEADAALHDARHAVWEMRSPELQRLDLVDALTASTTTVVTGSGVALHIAVTGSRRRLPASVDISLLRIGREAVINAMQHAKPQNLTLTFTFEPASVALCVADDGIGIDLTEAATAASRGHWGLSGMRDRAARHGGALTIERGPDGGTSVHVSIPLSRD